MTYKQVQTSMRNARMACYPKTPSTADEFISLLGTDKAAGFNQIKGEIFYHGFVRCPIKDQVTLLYIVPGTAKAVQQAKSIALYVDGTYKTAPAIFSQLIMVYAEIDGKVCIWDNSQMT